MTDKATIKDIAKAAGVGISTVSRVLNGYSGVREKTRDRVLQVCREMNFVPNAAARMLVKQSGQENTIALLMPFVAHQFFFEVITELQNTLKQFNLHSMIFSTEQGEEPVIHDILELRIRAVIIMGSPRLSSADHSLLKLYKVPLLYIDRHDQDSNFIAYDNIMGGRLAAQYLIEKKCRNVIFMGLADKSVQQNERFSGFRNYIAEHGGETSINEVFVEDEMAVYRLTRSLMQDPSIDGFFYFTDTMAMAGKQAARELQTRAEIIGYDDIYPSQFIDLSTIRQSTRVLGVEAANIIRELIRRTDDETGIPLVQKILEPELIIRE